MSSLLNQQKYLGHGTHVTALLFLLTQYMYRYIGCLNIHGTHVTALSFLLTQYMYRYHIYPTPPLGQDMTQGNFLSGV